MSMEQDTRGQGREQEARDDLDEIRRGVEKANEALTTGPSAEESQVILKARALDLAREPKHDDAGKFLHIIEFRLASETYAIESAFVREIHPLKDFTPLPGLPPFVLGIVNVRGEILSVVDLKRFLDLPHKGLGELNKVIIIRNHQMEFGILADAVLAARTIPLEAIQPSPPTVSGIGAEYLKGVTGKREIILDAEKILSDEKIIVDQESIEKHGSKPHHESEVV